MRCQQNSLINIYRRALTLSIVFAIVLTSLILLTPYINQQEETFDIKDRLKIRFIETIWGYQNIMEESSIFRDLKKNPIHSPCCYSVPNFKPLSLKCNTCSLVSSSGHLIGSNAGEDIDDADCVIRINDAPILGHEKDVGTRTTLRYLAPTGAKRLWKNRKQLLLGPSKPRVLIFYSQNASLLYNLQNYFPEIQIYRLKNFQNDQYTRIYQHYRQRLQNIENDPLVFPTSGFKILTLSLGICQSVQFYGIPPPNQCRNVELKNVEDMPYHYYDNEGENSNHGAECYNFNKWNDPFISHHNNTMEKYIFSMWIREGLNLTFRSPHWDPLNIK